MNKKEFIPFLIGFVIGIVFTKVFNFGAIGLFSVVLISAFGYTFREDIKRILKKWY